MREEALCSRTWCAIQASWYVGWIDPAGKRRCKSYGSGSAGKSIAHKERRRIEAELLTGTYQSNTKKTWTEFRQEYEAKVFGGLAIRSREEIKAAFDHFERIATPGRMSTIKTTTIDGFVARRRQEPGKKNSSVLSPATVNKDLRHLRAAFHKAKRWGYIAELPYVDLVKEPEKLAVYVTPDHFAAIYRACEQATRPAELPYPAADWWRGVLVFGYMTGWRISEILALRRDDLDVEGGYAVTRATDNKGNRDERASLHPVVVEHLRKLAAFHPNVFPWDHNKTTLYQEFAVIQEAAGIRLRCDDRHQHTRYCHVYGFHDLRRAFATMNADRLTGDALRQLMRHRSYSTTQRYINIGRQLDDAVAALHVPEVLRKTQTGR
jgi:integrase